MLELFIAGIVVIVAFFVIKTVVNMIFKLIGLAAIVAIGFFVILPYMQTHGII